MPENQQKSAFGRLDDDDEDDTKPEFYVEVANLEENAFQQQTEEVLISNMFVAPKRTTTQLRLEKDNFTARPRRRKRPQKL